MEQNNSTTTPEVTSVINQPAITPKSSNTKWVLLSLVLVLIMSGLALGAYYLGMQTGVKNPNYVQVDNKETVVATTSPTPEITIAVTPEEKLVTYESVKLPENSFKAYGISYPSDWTKTVKRTDDMADDFMLVKGEYTIKIYQAAMGGGGCVFEGDMPEGPYSDYRDKKYVDIITSVGTLRRFENTPTTSTNKRFSFCAKSSNGSFGSPTTIGVLNYEIPNNYDNATLLKMDEIIKTLKEK